jgi:hypothetical protein
MNFGYQIAESQHHFVVMVPKAANGKVVFYERFKWQDEIDPRQDRAKAEISKAKWEKIADTLKDEFNGRLKKQKLPAGRWKIGLNAVEKLLGKELLVLVWSIEDCDPSVIPSALKNWLGLSAEERWWLFTMTNAATGGINDKRGWRKALRYALTENPIEEKNRISNIFDTIYGEKDEE